MAQRHHSEQMLHRVADALSRPHDFSVVTARGPANVDVYPGDIVGLIAGRLAPARDTTAFPDLLTLAANQEAFHDAFLGICLEHCTVADGATGREISVATLGRWPLASNSAHPSSNPGDLFGLAENAAGTALVELVLSVATANLAVGRKAEGVAKGATLNSTIEIEIVSTVMFGGPQVMA